MESLQRTTVAATSVPNSLSRNASTIFPVSAFPLPDFPDCPRASRRHRSQPSETKFQPTSPKKISKSRKKSKSRRRVYPKRNWTPEEDTRLREIVNSMQGPFNWSDIAKHFDQRVGKQCRERWHNHLSDKLVLTKWTKEEDELLIKKHAIHGNRWAFLTQFFPGRTDNMIKNRWNTTLSRCVSSTQTPPQPQITQTQTVAPLMKDVWSQTQINISAESLNALFGFSKPTIGTATSLEEHKAEMIPSAIIEQLSFALQPAQAHQEQAEQHRIDLALRSPQFSLRIPVFNRNILETGSGLTGDQPSIGRE